MTFFDVERRQKLRFDLAGDPSCRSCSGTGWRERVHGLDGPLYTHGQLVQKNSRDERGLTFDEYTYGQSLAVATKRTRELGEQQRHTYSERELGQVLDRLAVTWPSLADPAELELLRSRDAYGWERARQRYLRSGSFMELERALDELHGRDEDLHRIFVRVYCAGLYGWPPRLTGLGQLRVQAALDIVDELMPEPVLLPQDAEDQLAAMKRAETVTELYERTGSLTKTARRCGITRTKAREIIRKAGLLEKAA